MADRELLELAAKAAGMGDGEYCEPNHEPAIYFKPCIFWSPLTDDGDALRLAVKLQLVIMHAINCAAVTRDDLLDQIERYNGDPCAATRRAIVRAAAAIGRSESQAGGVA